MLLRPILLTVVALCLIALAVVHADAAQKPDPPCTKAETLQTRGFLVDARAEYAALRKSDSPPGCAATGLRKLTVKECDRAAELADASPAEAVLAYRAILNAQPVIRDARCALTALRALPPAAKGDKGG
jgi:hypothetical protein